MKLLIKYIFPLLALAGYVDAQFDPFATGTPSNKTEAALISEVSTIAPGESFTVAVRLKHQQGWHAYYKNPGGIGIPLSFDWKLPAGYVVKNIQWPTPQLYHNQGSLFYTYEGEYHILADILTPMTAKLGDHVKIQVTANWQLCDEKSCENPESKDLSLSLPVAEKTATNTQSSPIFKQARSHLPIEKSDWAITVFKQGNQYEIQLTPGKDSLTNLEDIYFFSSDLQTNSSGTQKLTRDGDSYTLTINQNTQNDANNYPHLSGIIHSKTGWIDGNPSKGLLLDKIAITNKPLKSANVGKFLGILGGMLLGGLILNLMPCVFPVIGLKILGFAQQAGEEKKQVVLHGLTFAAGVLVSFWILSGLLLTLRNAALKGHGEDVGWGYQLQNPYIVLIILLLMFILALNMFGVFEIGIKATGVGGELQNKHGLTGSFFSGVLATVVATPCSAPFLGAAIGAAFVLPNIQFMLAFTAMALGLALPYLILSIFPSLVQKLPRPGPWMESFKQAMSFLLFATAGYLLWVYISQTGLDYMLNIILGLSIIALALWIYGRWNQPQRSNKTKTIAKTLTILGLLGGILLSLPPDLSKKLTWEKWSEQRVEELLDNGTPVFVDFTATWCATCQLNKKRAYTPEIVTLFQEYGIVALKADKTSPNPEIEKKLQELDRTAIPVNALYLPGKKDPIITPEILSANYLKELITENLKKPEKDK